MRTLLLTCVLALAACGGKTPPPSNDGTEPAGSDQPAAAACVKSGCSGTVCTEPGNEMMTTCEFKAEYACYRTATCERQPDGKCGWTENAELTACLENPPPIE